MGELSVLLYTESGNPYQIGFQVTDVKRPLLSVSALTQKGNQVHIGKDGGVITEPNGQKLRFHRRSGVFVLDIWVAPFQGQGK